MSHLNGISVDFVFDGEVNEFDAIEASEYSDTIEPGLYKVKVAGNELLQAETKDEVPISHNVLAFQFVIEEPAEMVGRKLFMRYSVNHPVDRVRNINRKQLGELCKSVGVPKLTNTTEILNQTLMATVTEREYNGRKYNEISKYEPLTGADALGVDIPPDYEESAPTQPSPTPATASEPIPQVASEELGF